MTFTFDCDTLSLVITDDIFALGNTLTVTINDVVQSGTLSVGNSTYTVTVTKDTLLHVEAKDVSGSTVNLSKGCYFSACENVENSILCKVISYANTNSDYNIILDYYLLKSANDCACKCEDLQLLESNLNKKLRNCQC